MFIAKTRSIAFVLPIDRVQNDQATKLLKRSIEVKVVRNSNANKQIFKMTKHFQTTLLSHIPTTHLFSMDHLK